MPAKKEQQKDPLAPKYTGRGTWEIQVTEEEVERLDNIPGLHEGVRRQTVYGTVDAVAVACHRLKRQLPSTPTAQIVDLSERYSLRDYQLSGVEFLISRLNRYASAFLADEMGLGKTRQAIVTAQLMGAPLTVIVCMASVRETWRDELKLLGIPEEDIACIGPSSSAHYRKDWERLPNAKFIISSYDLLPAVHEIRYLATDLLIIDEAHTVKSRRGVKRADFIEEIAMLSRWRLFLTGTPFDNRPRDLYRILYILLGGRKTFGSQWDFDKAYCGGGQGEHGWENKGATRKDELRLRLSYYMLRREKAQVAKDLPPLSRQVLWLPGSTAAKKWMQAAFTRRSQGDFQKALMATLESKIPAAIERAHEAKRFVLFTWLREHAARMHAELKKGGTPCVLIDGSMDTARRQKLIAQAAKEGMGLVATGDSVGTGVNMQGVASFGIMHAFDWRPMLMAQREARIHRLGQTSNVHWVYLACTDTMDEPVVKNLVSKLDAFRDITPGSTESPRGLRDALNADIGGGSTSDEEALAALLDEMAKERGE